ncbi:tripartite tricarboxylate transporter substrate binding protein [Pigmentiphaga sp.]|uniref:Bug family tripartite tricarboxylate transporter substrate binding protein n=1 Tax=Pigmentiphaga sp. TaxID=1977564 RepID=UPI0025E36F3F|nr:tripartite tricarboxylate transporter substrate binding protein [Pigmentiphaga sp.]
MKHATAWGLKFSLEASIVAALVGGLAFAPGAGAADDYPNRPIRMLVGFSAGGATDLSARMIALHLSERLGQSVVVENRPGAGGSIAASAVAKAPADGYTILYTSAAHAINAALYKSLPFDPVADFQPITTVTTTLNALIAHPSLPARGAAEFIAYAKANPGGVSMASTGIGSSSHMAQVLFTSMAGITVNHVPYKGTGEAIRDIVSGEIKVTIDAVTAYLPYLRNGSLKVVCLGDVRRSALLPDAPTCDETGLPGYAVRSWQGVLTTANVPRPIVDRLNREINAILKSPETIRQMQAAGARPLGGTPEEYAAIIKQDIAKLKELVSLAGIQPQ